MTDENRREGLAEGPGPFAATRHPLREDESDSLGDSLGDARAEETRRDAPEGPDHPEWLRRAEAAGVEIDNPTPIDELDPAADHHHPEGYDPEEDDPDYSDTPDGFFERVWAHKRWIFLVLGVLGVVCVAAGLLSNLAANPSPTDQETPAPEARQEAQGQPQPAPAPQGSKDTGIVFGEPVLKDDGTYYLRAGQIAWKGKLATTDTGDELTLEGPTAAQFKRAVALPHGSVMTGVFGRAEPGKPIVHGTFHRTTIGQDELTTGTYYAMDEDGVLVEGSYVDHRDGNKVTRTYTEHAPGEDRVIEYDRTFEAPPGVPIPVLVGWEPPAAKEVDEAA